MHSQTIFALKNALRNSLYQSVLRCSMNSKPSACSYVEKNEVRKPRHTAEQVSGATDIQQNKSDTA